MPNKSAERAKGHTKLVFKSYDVDLNMSYDTLATLCGSSGTITMGRIGGSWR